MAGDTPKGWKTALEKVFLALLKRGGELVCGASKLLIYYQIKFSPGTEL